jgi:NAD(P)-dependent dehydrogenase (short-subunit alcohol dehydrogenase family)
MREFQGKVAVITGGSNGIGYALAERCLKEGMKVVIASVGENTAAQAETRLRDLYPEAQLFGVRTDVSNPAEVEELARQTLNAFGSIHLLFNNAGVGVGGYIWENTVADWEWLLGVNLMGVVHCIRTFVPIMLAQDSECYIVNTSSMAGLVSLPFIGAYGVSKHAVVALSEVLQGHLKWVNSKIKVAVVCPAFVRTEFSDSQRNRPVALRNENYPSLVPEEARQAVLNGMDPVEVADKVFTAIRNEKFYILTHPEHKKDVQMRMENILEERDPTYFPPINN